MLLLLLNKNPDMYNLGFYGIECGFLSLPRLMSFLNIMVDDSSYGTKFHE